MYAIRSYYDLHIRHLGNDIVISINSRHFLDDVVRDRYVFCTPVRRYGQIEHIVGPFTAKTKRFQYSRDPLAWDVHADEPGIV